MQQPCAACAPSGVQVGCPELASLGRPATGLTCHLLRSSTKMAGGRFSVYSSPQSSCTERCLLGRVQLGSRDLHRGLAQESLEASCLTHCLSARQEKPDTSTPACMGSKHATPLEARLNLEACALCPATIDPAQEPLIFFLRGHLAASLQARCLKADLPLPDPTPGLGLGFCWLALAIGIRAFPGLVRHCAPLRGLLQWSSLQGLSTMVSFKSQALGLPCHLATAALPTAWLNIAP